MLPSLPPIHFHFLTPVTLHERTRLKLFLKRLFKKEGRSIEALNYIFCTDAYLLTLNRAHLQHDTYTDIITFELSPPGASLLADIYISVDRVRENAKSFNVSLQNELHRVIFHGALHCCGFKDKTATDKKKMRTQENALLDAYFVPRGTK